MSDRKQPGHRRIVVYCPAQLVGFSALMLYELCWFGLQVHRELGGAGAGSVLLVSADGQPIRNPSGVRLAPDAALADAGRPDVVFVAGFWGSSRRTLEHESALMPWLRDAHAAGAIVAGVSNGSIYLAEAGLLDGRIATTYPPYGDEFAARYPDVELALDRALTTSGRVYCANGIASGCDLAVLILETVFGAAVSREVEQRFLMGFNRSYMLNAAEFDGQKFHSDEAILAAQKWMELNYADDRFMETAAAIAGMSPRNFRRRFKSATGDTPQAYLHRIRISVAKDLLRDRHHGITDICFRIGYSDLGSFNRIFRRLEGVSPREFRVGRG